MKRSWLLGSLVCAALVAPHAHAAPSASAAGSASAPAPASPASASAPASPSTPPPSAVPSAPAPAHAAGLAVIAVSGANAAAWTLAQSVYANDALRPSSLDEAHARVLAGESPPPGAPRDLADLAETRAAVRGDDAPSRAILASLANSFHVRGIVVVEMDRSASAGVQASASVQASARVFVAESATFDAAHYGPDAPAASAEPLAWSGAVASLARAFREPAEALTPAPAPPASPASRAAAPALATSGMPPAPRTSPEGSTSSAFYKSPWFWGAVGAAAFGAGAIYFATRDNPSGAIHLEMQAPR